LLLLLPLLLLLLVLVLPQVQVRARALHFCAKVLRVGISNVAECASFAMITS
jgi:hypothetical protein